MFFNHDEERKSLASEYEIAKLQDKLNDKHVEKELRDDITRLKAQLLIEEAKTALVKSEAKAEYAEHVMKVSDDRVNEIRAIYEEYARNLTAVVKASHPQPINNVVK